MIDIKSEYSKIKPKYIDNNNYLFVSDTRIIYKHNQNLSVTINIENDNKFIPYLVRVSDIDQNLKIDCSNTIINEYLSDNLNYTYEAFAIDDGLFNILNSIVSCGISPLNIGIINISNGILNLKYFHLEYSINYSTSINNKSINFNSYINFDIIWYMYQFYKNNSIKGSSVNIGLVLNDNDYIINCGNIFVKNNISNIHNEFVNILGVNFDLIIANRDMSKVDIFARKYISENLPTIYKHLTKCLGDNINLISGEKYDIMLSTNSFLTTYIIVAKGKLNE